MNGNSAGVSGKEKLVVEVVAAHNLMPKDGEGSSSPFVEVEFDNQRQRTQVKHKDLNPVWNERLVFLLADPADLPYRTVEINVFNERRSGNSRNFLGKVRISGSGVAREGEEVVQLFTLDKRSLFSHIRGEISLKLYVSTREEVKSLAVNGGGLSSSSLVQRKSKKLHHQPNAALLAVQQQQKLMLEQSKPAQQVPSKQAQRAEPSPGEMKPVVIAAAPQPVTATGGGGGGGGVLGGFLGGGSSEFLLKETKPSLGGGPTSKDKTSSTYDLVEQMQYLYVKVVKAKEVSTPFGGGGELVAEVKLGNYRGITKRVGSGSGSNGVEWDQVFAFSKDCIQSSVVEVFVKERNKDEFLGRVWFDLNEVPKRVPPDSSLAPQWYRMEDRKGEKAKSGEVMISIWFGTQADEAFAEAWHSKSANVNFDGLCSIKSKVYLSPKLWYLRLSVIEAQDIVPSERGPAMARFPELSVKAQVGNQVLRTRASQAAPNRSLSSPFWNEDMVFVVAEPFEDYLIVSVEDRVGPGRDEVVGRVLLPATSIERRTDDKPVVSSDLRPTAKQLWKPHIGVLEMGILGATGLMPMKIKEGKGGSTDAYCVAKYGQKWVRTRTVNIASNAGPRDARIGKVRIRLSTLESDRVYTHSYPLLMLHTSGVKKMGELHLAVRFSCANMANMLHMYAIPLLPKMHYVHPLSVNQLDSLRYQAMNVVASRLSRAEPPLGRDVVEYMLDHDSHMWSMRRSKANFFRLMSVLSGAVAINRWVEVIRNWHKPVYSALFVVVFLWLVCCPEFIIPIMLLFMALTGLWRYRSRSRHPPHMDTRLSHAESVFPDELDEEFDSFPTSRSAEVVRMRYDRLRSVAGRIQTVVGDMATQGERFQALLSWRDPRATFLFIISCLFASVGFYAVPFRVVVVLWGLYALRPPRFRSKLPSRALSFFRRLPTKADGLL
ncbi:hypothetical protein EUGRSUZ_K03580 [Eucalyptus grandis]|uniref:Uncharacterized protein n=2 Tax=Eucalyptus grandis TaxID=71139 RepID=A0ACC3J1K5_EUCGR|nr:hypothetical protein EUGRSUZ_K03580 [Eucalyptus grandis]